MEKIRNFSLKKAIVFYVTVSFIVTFFFICIYSEYSGRDTK